MKSSSGLATKPSEIIDHNPGAIRDAFRDSRPRTPRELYNYIRAYIRNENGQPVRLGHTAVVEGHSSPFEFVSDAFFGKHRRQVVHAARGTGKTLSHSLVQVLKQYFDGFLARRTPYRSLTIGAVERQAKDAVAIMSAIWNQDEYRHAITGGDASVGAMKTRIKTIDGSETTTTVATIRGVNSPHVPEMTLDELDLWDPFILKQAKSIPKAAGTHARAVRLLSTMKFATGVMADAVSTAADRGYKSYVWGIFEAMEQCPPERKCSECPLFEWGDQEGGILCGGRAKHSTGHFPIDEVIEVHQDHDRETFETEWLSERPERTGLVYGRDWSESYHCMPFEISYNEMLPLTLSIDQGWTNPFAVLYIQEDGTHEQTRLIGEEYLTHTLASEVGKIIGAKLNSWGVSTGRPLELIFDAEDPSGARELARNLWTDSTKNRRYRARLRHPGKIDVLNDLRYCRQALKKRPGTTPALAVSNVCRMFKWEMVRYRYPTREIGERPKSEKPIDKNNHMMDAWRRYETTRRRTAGGKPGQASDPR